MAVPFSVLIIGAGNIGAFFDTPQSSAVLSHAHAFTRHPGFLLRGFVDADPERAARAAQLWGGTAFGSVEEAFAGGVVDVAVVAVPDEYHYPLLLDLARYPVKLVFAEKPLAKSAEQGAEIMGLYHRLGIGLAVNYTRRYVPELAGLRAQIADGDFGNYLSGTGYYGKGTLHNGSHMVDLVRFLVAEIQGVSVVSRVDDFYPKDPSCSAVLTLAGGAAFFLQAVDCRSYTVFELDLLFGRKRIRMTDAGFRVELQEVRDSARFAGYRNLEVCGTQDTRLGNALYLAATNIHDHLAEGAALLCGAEDGYRALALCCDLLKALP